MDQRDRAPADEFELPILAFDPGEKSTGIAFFDAIQRPVTQTLSEQGVWKNLMNPESNWTEARVWIIEEYIIPARGFRGFYSPTCAYLIGAILLKSKQLGIKAVLQKSAILQSIKNEMLYSWGWSWKNRHELAALKHIAYYLLKSIKQNQSKKESTNEINASADMDLTAGAEPGKEGD